MNEELETILKEAVLASGFDLPWHFPGGTAKNQTKLSQNNVPPDRDLKPGPPEYEEC
jgi:hypothetical protein